MKLKTTKRIVLKCNKNVEKTKQEAEKKKPKLKISNFKIMEKENKETSIQENEKKKTQIEDVNFLKCSKNREKRHKKEKYPKKLIKKSLRI